MEVQGYIIRDYCGYLGDSAPGDPYMNPSRSLLREEVEKRILIPCYQKIGFNVSKALLIALVFQALSGYDDYLSLAVLV